MGNIMCRYIGLFLVIVLRACSHWASAIASATKWVSLIFMLLFILSDDKHQRKLSQIQTHSLTVNELLISCICGPFAWVIAFVIVSFDDSRLNVSSSIEDNDTHFLAMSQSQTEFLVVNMPWWWRMSVVVSRTCTETFTLCHQCSSLRFKPDQFLPCMVTFPSDDEPYKYGAHRCFGTC